MFLETKEAKKTDPDKDFAGELLLGSVLIAFSIFIIVEAFRMPQYGPWGFFMSPGFVPLLSGAVLLLLSIALVAGAISMGGYRQLGSWIRETVAADENRRFLAIFLFMGLYVLGLLGRVHFFIATLIYFGTVFTYLKVGSRGKIAIYTLLATFLAAFLLPLLFEIPLP